MIKFARLAATLALIAELLAPITPAFAAGVNLVSNPSAETATAGAPSGWQQGGWGANTRSFSYLSTGAQSGTKALGLTVSGYSSGDAKWYFAPVTVTPGTRYDFRNYYQSTVATSLVANIVDSAGVSSYIDLGTQPASAAWRQSTASFTAPANARTATVFHLIAANGTLTTDNFSLTADTPVPPPPPSTTGVPNPSAETAVAGQPQGWTGSQWGSHTAAFTYPNTGHTGTRSLGLTVTNYTSGNAHWSYAPQAVTPGARYVFTDWYKSTVASEVDIAVTMSDGSIQYFYVGKAPAASTWTRERAEFVMPAGAVRASLMHLMYQNGTLTTDDYSFLVYAPVGFNRGLVTLTFDDGWTNQYTSGLPVMNRYGLKGTYYIISGYLTRQPDYMTVAQITSLKNAGHQIGSHTVSHPDLTTLTAANLDAQLKNSQSTLVSRFGGPVQDLAAPYGGYNNATVAAAAKYYRSQRSVDAGFNSKDDFDIYRLRVQNMTNTTTPAQVQAWVAEAARDKTWLILTFHQISPNLTAGEYSTTPANFDTEMSNLKNSGVPVVTMGQAISEISPQLAR